MFNLLLESTAAKANNNWWVYLVLLGLVVVMLVVPMFTNRKRSKEYSNMINSVNVGDTIRTVGGVIGRIVKINEKDGYKTIIIETGAKNNKTTMEMDMASINTVLKSSKTAVAPEKVEDKEEPAKEETTQEETKTEEIAAEPAKTQAKPKTAKAKTSAKK